MVYANKFLMIDKVLLVFLFIGFSPSYFYYFMAEGINCGILIMLMMLLTYFLLWPWRWIVMEKYLILE